MISLFKKTMKDKRGQIFLVCTVIITIYMLSFINIVYELNLNQYQRTTETEEFEAAYDNIRLETNKFVISMIANYTQPASIIVSNAVAQQIMNNWFDFISFQMSLKGYTALFTIDESSTPFSLSSANGQVSFTGVIDVYMSCNYMTIDTQFSYDLTYTLSYVNTATNAIIELTMQSFTDTNYIGSADVTVNTLATLNYLNGTYTYSAPLVGGDTIEATTADQIIITYVV